jgi:hypothetical protein
MVMRGDDSFDSYLTSSQASKGPSTVSGGSGYQYWGVPKNVWSVEIPDYRDVKTGSDPSSGAYRPGNGSENSGINNMVSPMTGESIYKYLASAGKGTVRALQRQLYAGGFYGQVQPKTVSFGKFDRKTVLALNKVMAATLQYNSQNPSRRTSWQEILGSASASGKGRNGKDGSGPDGGVSAPRDVTQSSVQLSNRTQSQGYLQGAMANLLGRAPTAKEVRSFQGTLNAAERKHPDVTRTHYSAGGSSSSSTSSGGLDRGVTAENAVSGEKFQKERDTFGIGTYMDAFESILGSGQ